MGLGVSKSDVLDWEAEELAAAAIKRKCATDVSDVVIAEDVDGDALATLVVNKLFAPTLTQSSIAKEPSRGSKPLRLLCKTRLSFGSKLPSGRYGTFLVNWSSRKDDSSSD